MRHPVVHFVLLGAALFMLARGVTNEPSIPTPSRDVLDAATSASLREDWIARHGRPPAPAERQHLVDAALDEEALYRAALARGLDHSDPVVQGRLLRNMRFLVGDGDDDAALYRDALALGLPASDLVVRRRLVDRMRHLLQEPAFAVEPSDAELQAYLDANPARFAAPARVRLPHVFLGRQRGAALAADARDLLHRLGPADVSRAAELGDPFPLPVDLSSAAAQDLARHFGAELAAAAVTLAPGSWHGPLPSPYGLHLIWVHQRWPAAAPPLDAVRSAVRAALLDERAAAALRAGLAALRAVAAPGAAR